MRRRRKILAEEPMRCHRRRKMMGRGADGGCGTEEKPCPISRVPPSPSKSPPEQQPVSRASSVGLDSYTQAKKALSGRSPFDTDDAQVSTSVPTLPSGLANSLYNRADSRKRQRKAHGPEKTRGSRIWAETEDCFREFALDDVEQLEKLGSLGFLGSDTWFLVPNVGNVLLLGSDVVIDSKNECSLANVDPGLKEEVKEEPGQLMEIDSVDIEKVIASPEEENGCSSSQMETSCSRGLEWLLGCKNKVHLTTERPSKKRKLLGGDAGLEKLLVSRAVNGSRSLCHYCSLGVADNGSNRLLVCHSCRVAVHQRCYGVQGDITGSWVCTWCKLSDTVESGERPCVLCPKQGGALKPISKSGNGENSGVGCKEFAHLLCCQWIPEVYIDDMRKMEPVMNVEGVNDTRRKLVCNLCKVKCGACVRCSNGTCRTSFHPICAREAGNRMEIWGKFGCDEVELRAYCSKHSEDHNNSSNQQLGQLSVASCSDSHDSEPQAVTPILSRPHKLKIGRKNGDKIAVRLEPTDNNKAGNSAQHEEGLSDTRSKCRLQSESDEALQHVSRPARIVNDYASSSDSINYTMILKKLIDRGKVNLKDVASEIGASPDSLASISSDNLLAPDLRSKIVTWLRDNAHIGNLQRNLKVRIKSSVTSKDEKVAVRDSNSASVTESDVPGDVPVKSVDSIAPCRRTKNNILKDNKVIEGETGDALVLEKRGEVITEDAGSLHQENVSISTEKHFVESDEVDEKLSISYPKCEEGGQEQGPSLFEPNMALDSVPEKSTCSVLKPEVISTSYIHPVIHKETKTMLNVMLPNVTTYEVKGSRDQDVSSLEVSSGLHELIQHLNSGDKISRSLEQLADARNVDLLKTPPVDEVEGELIFYQHSLLNNAVKTKRIADNLISEVVRILPQEMDVSSKRMWDSVIVNQYTSELKEAKKQGRKEKRHKEAQAVLSAATAAAAASTRISSLRKDTMDEAANQENLMKVNTSTARPGPYTQQMPRAKEMLTKSEIKSGSVQPLSKLNKSHPRTCDICRRSDTLLNPTLVCSGCKVAVHLDCYGSVKDYTGPWYCELCEDEMSSRSSSDVTVNALGRPHLAIKCGLCGGSVGAFRKSTDDQWVHAFCAEWVLESTFRRGQGTPVEGMESVVKGRIECHICHQKQGVCIKCNYGHCHSMFHPSCARSAGLYMNVKSSGSKLQHKAYCEKHSLEQKAKAETQKHGIEELKSLKLIRVELERLRLLCERIIKREKLKRELVLCSQEVLVSNRDSAALSALVRSPFFPPDTSSESATTSLRGNTDDCRSGSEAIQRSDDITVDSTVPGKRRIKFPLSMDHERKTDDSSTSHLFMQKPRERVSFAGKQIPHRPLFVAQNISDGLGEKKSKSRKT